MTSLPQTLTFENKPLRVINHQGRHCFAASDLAKALNYSTENSVTRIFNRNRVEFRADMSWTVKLTFQGQTRETRVFSLRGAHLIAMKASTPLARKFRVWVLDILEQQAEQAALAAPSAARLKNLVGQLDAETVRAIIRDELAAASAELDKRLSALEISLTPLQWEDWDGNPDPGPVLHLLETAVLPRLARMDAILLRAAIEHEQDKAMANAPVAERLKDLMRAQKTALATENQQLREQLAAIRRLVKG